ncbi:MAG: L-histidine N(alpha)-methyltransferase [Caulobacteraceae bacterium]|nr:L-histidine N(alpha)-methyltransferase [Caulobacter sp.]
MVDLAPVQESFAEALLAGLSRPRKAIPPRFLYDARGSELFEAITRLPEYYPTRAELEILDRHAGEMGEGIGPGAVLIEFGAGSARKAQALLKGLQAPVAYAPIDVSLSALTASADEIAAARPELPVVAVCADYGQPFDLPPLAQGRGVGFFPGSTIGNLQRSEARAFLELWAPKLGEGGAMLVGVDLKKPSAIVVPAYDDAQGTTAQFSLNVLARANRELGGDFDLDGFAHRVDYDEASGRVAIHLESLREQRAQAAGRTFAFAAGERIHVEDSWKYAPDDFRALAESAGYRPARMWTDDAERFSVHLLEL